MEIKLTFSWENWKFLKIVYWLLLYTLLNPQYVDLSRKMLAGLKVMVEFKVHMIDNSIQIAHTSIATIEMDFV